MISQAEYDKLKMEISTISHEIRNPLTLVYSTLQLIESQHPEVLTFRYWPQLRQDVEYIRQLLDELSAYNNSENLTMSLVDSNTFFKTLSLSFASSLTESEIEFVSKIDNALPSIPGDSIKLRQVFLNILGNARDALSLHPASEDFTPVIHMTVSSTEDALSICIKDNGCGIPKDRLSSIFEPFVTYKQSGTGLGLAIASRIIKSHNGTIQVSSVPGVHTTFLLTLPVKKNSEHKPGD